MKNIIFLSENFNVLVMQFSVYLNRLVFVMRLDGLCWLIWINFASSSKTPFVMLQSFNHFMSQFIPSGLCYLNSFDRFFFFFLQQKGCLVVFFFLLLLLLLLHVCITKTRLYNIDPLKPHFCIVQLGFTGVYIIFLISVLNHRLWVLVRTASARRF